MPDVITILGKIIIAFFIICAIIFVLIIAAMGIAGIHAKEESMMADYSYELSLSTSKPLYNATLLIPLPCRYETESGEYDTFINLSDVSCKYFDQPDISMQIESWNGYTVLNISSKSILPLYKNHIDPIPIYPGQNESELPPTPATVYSNNYSSGTQEQVSMEIHRYIKKDSGEIDTKQPFDNEELMRPFTILNMTGKDDGFFSKDYFSGKISDEYSKSQIEVPVFLSYETDRDNILDISSSVRGANEWWCFGWSGNSYEQRIGNSFGGSRNGTYMLEGYLVAGEGVY
jgi:hypothetical protein